MFSISTAWHWLCPSVRWIRKSRGAALDSSFDFGAEQLRTLTNCSTALPCKASCLSRLFKAPPAISRKSVWIVRKKQTLICLVYKFVYIFLLTSNASLVTPCSSSTLFLFSVNFFKPASVKYLQEKPRNFSINVWPGPSVTRIYHPRSFNLSIDIVYDWNYQFNFL